MSLLDRILDSKLWDKGWLLEELGPSLVGFAVCIALGLAVGVVWLISLFVN